MLPTICYENLNGISLEVLTKEVNRFADALINTYAKRILLIPPDITRFNSGAGIITQLLFKKLKDSAHCNILPAVGSHREMTREEQITFFGEEIPPDRYLYHNWRTDTIQLGVVPSEFISNLSGGSMNEEIPVEINKHIVNGEYDHIISIGQVVPHEVAGMANYTKNIFVGCGGYKAIDSSHLLSVYTGFEKWMGFDNSPVRQLFDYTQKNFYDTLPLTYMMTVVSNDATPLINGLFIGNQRSVFEKAVALSQKINITHTGQKIDTCVVYLPAEEFRSAWLGNKAVYRTRKALAKNANLIILAPGFECFGEDEINDRIIRKYGYIGQEPLLELFKSEMDLQNNKGALAHLIHGSSNDNFNIIYCTKSSFKNDITSVGYLWGDILEYNEKYKNLYSGFNKTIDGDIYFINNPALGLWMD